MLELVNMDRSIVAGITGFLLAVVINVLSPVSLYFVPSFLVAILVIYFFRLGTLKDGLVAVFMIYVFNDGIYETLVGATLYNQLYPAFYVDAWTVISPIVSAVTAVIAAYIGVLFAQARKPAEELPPIVQSQAPPT
jgi:hypothetical protein